MSDCKACQIKLTFSDETIKVLLHDEKISFSAGPGYYPIQLKVCGYQRVTVYGEADPYEGAYEVTPKISAQKLETKKKVLTDDINVKGVPAYETSNTAGGKTFYIAKE